MSFFDTELPAGSEIIDTVSEAIAAGESSRGHSGWNLANPRTLESGDDIDATLRLNDDQVRVRIYAPPKGTIPNPFLLLSTEAGSLSSGIDESGGAYSGFPARLVELIERLSVALDPVMVSSFKTIHVSTGPKPKAVTPTEVPLDLDRIPWLGVYSTEAIQQFGGRERVLDTPAWRVDGLANGSILVITTRDPWDGYESPLPADRYLLDGDDVGEK